MQEIIVPEDGLIYKTIDGRSIMQIHYNDDSATFSIFDKNEKPSILLICGENGKGIIIQDGQKKIDLIINSDFNEIRSNNGNSTTLLICNEEASGLIIGNGEKEIGLTSSIKNNEIRFTNETGNVTHFIRDDETGGQLTLADKDGNPLLDMGINSSKDGSLIMIRNKNGDSVVTLMCHRNSGLIQVTDERDKTIWTTD